MKVIYLDGFGRILGLLNAKNGGSLLPNLWALWGKDCDFVVRFDSAQCSVLDYIYASANYIHRRQLWDELKGLQNFYVAPWIFVGDFNAILGAHEKQGQRLPPSIVMIREGNCCADIMASDLGHDLTGTVWFDMLPPSLSLDFFKDRIGLPNHRFP